MFNVYKNQQSQQTGGRNLMGPKTLPTKCDEKWFMCTVLNKNDVRNITSQFLFEKVFYFSNGCY